MALPGGTQRLGGVNLPTAEDPSVAALLSRCTFPPTGTSVTCAVSGGADSTALLALAVAAGLRVEAVHVDHGLRPGSDAEAGAVAALARRWGAGFRGERVSLAPGPNLSERARAARHGAVGPGALWGHTADDQAETVLIRLLRGTGPSGLAAMRTEGHPMLGLRRAETRALCRHLGVDVLEDPTNDDPRFVRTRVRHEVLPRLHDVAGRDVVPLLCRLAGLAGEQADLLDGLVEGIDPTEVAPLRDLPPALAASALRRWWQDGTGRPGPGAAGLARIREVVEGRATSCDVVGGWRVHRSGGRLELVPPVAAGPTGRAQG